MSWFLSITNFDELKMVPEGQADVHGTSPGVVVYMACAQGPALPRKHMLKTHLPNQQPCHTNTARSSTNLPNPSYRSPTVLAGVGRCEGQEMEIWGWDKLQSLWSHRAVPPPRPTGRGHWVMRMGSPGPSEYLNPQSFKNFPGSRQLFN